MRQFQRARDRCGAHHEDIHLGALGAQSQALLNAKPVLLINDRQAKIFKGHRVLKDRMRAHENVNRAICQILQLLTTRGAFIPPGEHIDSHPGTIGQRPQTLQMLAGQNFRGSHQNTLPAALDRLQQSHKAHQCFSSPDISLQQPIHAPGAGHIRPNLRNCLALRSCGCIGQLLQNFLLQMTRACGDPACANPRLRPRNRLSQLVSQKFVIGQAHPRRTMGRRISHTFGRMCFTNGRGKIWPAIIAQHRGLDPLLQIWHFVQGRTHGLGHELSRNPGRQRVDGFKLRQLVDCLQPQNIFGMHHLRAVIKHLKLARNQSFLTQWQDALEIVPTRMEKDQFNGALRILHDDAIWLATASGRNVLNHAHAHAKGLRRR